MIANPGTTGSAPRACVPPRSPTHPPPARPGDCRQPRPCAGLRATASRGFASAPAGMTLAKVTARCIRVSALRNLHSRTARRTGRDHVRMQWRPVGQAAADLRRSVRATSKKQAPKAISRSAFFLDRRYLLVLLPTSAIRAARANRRFDGGQRSNSNNELVAGTHSTTRSCAVERR